jgi:hypothetical protein
MSDPFGFKPRMSKVHQEELARRIKFTCSVCGEDCEFGEMTGELVHSSDMIQISSHGIRQDYADHDPSVPIIDTTGRPT